MHGTEASPSGGAGSTCGLPPALTELSIWEGFLTMDERGRGVQIFGHGDRDRE